MKKVTKLAALMLTLVMALSLCACGKDTGKDLVGTWAMDCNLASAMAEELGDDYADFDAPLNLTILMDFNEDGTYRMYIDEATFSDSINGWIDEFITYSAEMMYEMFEDQGMSREDADAAVMESFGMGIEDYMRDQISTSLDVNELMGEMESSGSYKTKGDKLYMAEGSDDFDDNSYDIFTVNGNSLTLELPEGADPSEGEIVPGLEYPLNFQKK